MLVYAPANLQAYHSFAASPRHVCCAVRPHFVEEHIKQVQHGIRTAHSQQAGLCGALLHAGDGGLEAVQGPPLCCALVWPVCCRAACSCQQSVLLMGCPAQAADNILVRKLTDIDGCFCFQVVYSDGL